MCVVGTFLFQMCVCEYFFPSSCPFSFLWHLLMSNSFTFLLKFNSSDFCFMIQVLCVLYPEVVKVFYIFFLKLYSFIFYV